MARRLGVTWCGGGCGLSATRHREGCIYLGVIHYRERRFTRRAARTFLMLVARLDRETDDGYLNIELYDWFYLWRDSVSAAQMAKTLGFRLPASVFDQQRNQCILLAARRGVNLTKYRRVYQWARA
jgi:hypothetical protein